MASLFLSYSRVDASQVGPLAAALEADGHNVWWDQHISGGQVFADAIESALESADVVIACWTANSVHSGWVRDEAAVGRDKGRLVPVSLDGCLPPLGFRQYHTIDLLSWNGQPQSPVLDPLRAAIAEKTGDTSHPKAAFPAQGFGSRARFEPRPWVIASAAALVMLAGGTFLYPRVSARSGNFEPRVAVAQFSLVSTDLPREIPNMLGQEIVAAFGAENAVTVISPADRSAGAKAPFVMDGNVSRLGPAVRFTVNLKNQRSGVVLWSNAYEHEVADAVAARQAAVGASQVDRKSVV